MNIGFSQARAAVTMWAWCAILAVAALSTRFLAPHEHGVWHTWRTVVVGCIGGLALPPPGYIVYFLQIVQPPHPRLPPPEHEAPAAAPRAAPGRKNRPQTATQAPLRRP